ncbi:MAG: hypothetical protein QOJ59_4574, partial [Thermomicrobiales bacterium]|nr:hypothetical protein [Thermomicrobiales bacterium]
MANQDRAQAQGLPTRLDRRALLKRSGVVAAAPALAAALPG